MNPEVSVIIPTYNRCHLLKRAILTVLSQTYKDFELIIVDDGSCDDTVGAVRDFNDERIRCIRQDHKGAAAAINRGIDASRTRYIAFLDDDDEWLPQKLKIQMDVFKKEPPETGVVYTGRWRIRKGKKTYGPSLSILKKNGNIHKELFTRETFVPLVCAMVRRECFEKVGKFDEALPTSNDYDLWIRISKHFFFKYIPQPLAIINYTRGCMSRDPQKIIEARKILLNKYADELKTEYRETHASFLKLIGRMLLMQGNKEEGRRFLKEAVDITTS